MNRYLFLFALGLVYCSCQESKPGSSASSADTTQTTGVQTAPPSAATAPQLPSVPLELVEKLWNECTHVDYIFYNLPMSMSLDEKTSIQYAIRYIAEDPAILKTECQPAGHVIYQINGNIALEGDFYFSSGCTYFVFMEKQKPVYANFMTDEGIKYFNNQIQQGLQLRQKAQQGQQ